MADDTPSPHVRARIRRAAADALTTGCPSLGGRVFPGRASPLAEDELPCAVLYTPEESVEVTAYGKGALQSRIVSLDVHVAVADADDGWDVADAIAAEVEAALLPTGALAAGGAKTVALKNTVAAQDTAGEVPVLVLALRFHATAITAAGSPGATR